MIGNRAMRLFIFTVGRCCAIRRLCSNPSKETRSRSGARAQSISSDPITAECWFVLNICIGNAMDAGGIGRYIDLRVDQSLKLLLRSISVEFQDRNLHNSV